MKCEKCVVEGKKSKLYIERGEKIDPELQPETFYDEEGAIHIHWSKPNKRAPVHCSNGHKGMLICETKCITCGEGEEEKVVWDE